MDDDMSNQLITHADESEPLVYKLNQKQNIPLYENTLPIHRKIYDKANMEMYELYANIKTNSPDCVFVGIKTDCPFF